MPWSESMFMATNLAFYKCGACPSILLLHPSQITKDAPLQKKEVDDVLGGADAWKNAPKTDGERAWSQYTILCLDALLAILQAHLTLHLPLLCLCTAVFEGIALRMDMI